MVGFQIGPTPESKLIGHVGFKVRRTSSQRPQKKVASGLQGVFLNTPQHEGTSYQRRLAPEGLLGL